MESSERAARGWVVVASLSAALSVVAGAFAAHALRARLAPEMLSAFETGARYQMFHAIALLAVGAWLMRGPNLALKCAAWLFAIGTVLFSGSLYGMALSNVRALGAVTPFGGLCFIIGWIALALGVARPSASRP